MLNTPYLREQRRIETSRAKVSTIIFWAVLAVLVTCFMAFSVRLSALAIVKIHSTVNQGKD